LLTHLYLIGVKDALLQEINCELHLGSASEDVKEQAINKELEQKLGLDAKKDLMTNINKMKSDKTHRLGKISELHNHSKHRAMLKKDIVSVDGAISSFSLIDPVTEERMKDQIIEYLTDSYERIEKLQKTVRENIPKYLTNL
jgi:hypothetical protein